MKKMRDDFAKLLGLAIMTLIIGGGLVAIVYALIGSFTDNGRHWLAVVLVFALPFAYALGLQSAKAHRSGLERGIDLKLGARERAQQSTRPITTPINPAASAVVQVAKWNDDLLPRGSQAVIITRRDVDNEPIEM